MVQGASDRSETLVQRVLEATPEDNWDIASDAELARCTHGRETLFQVTCGATRYDDSILEGLDNPMWRQTSLISDDQMLEFKAVDLTFET